MTYLLVRGLPQFQTPRIAMSEQFNRKSEREKRRELRASMPDAEVMLWSRLKGRQLLGCRFRRQYSVGSYVIDFFSAEIKLGIEVDGGIHRRNWCARV